MRHRLTSPLVCLGFALSLVAQPASARSTPKLAVVVIFDQLPADALSKAAPLFQAGGQAGGFAGLKLRSTAHYDAAYTYAATETGPGHATLSTGSNPNVHGICANRWFDAEGEEEYCVGDPAASVLGAATGDETPNAKKGGVSAKNLRAQTLADAVKLGTGGRGRVITLSIKDRAAILTAGLSGDLAIFYDTDQGHFTTSTAYADALPPWLLEAGSTLPATSRREGKWSPLPLPKNSTFVLPIDDREGESVRYGFTTTFPHDLASISDAKDQKKAYRGTPQALNDLIDLGLLAVKEEKLGEDSDVDLLVLALSPTDFVGHWYGPGSLEALEMLRQADLALRRLVRALDKKLGQHGWVMAVTADHGVAPMPEALAAVKIKATRIQVQDVDEKLKAIAAQIVGPNGPKPSFHPPHLFLDLKDVDDAKRVTLLDALEAELSATAGIVHVYRADTLSEDNDPFREAFAASIASGRCDTMLVRPKPGTIFAWKNDTGADHGTPYGYDNRVPLLISGPGVRRGRYAEVVDPRDLAVTLAFLINIAPPTSAQGKTLSAVGAEATLPMLAQ